MAIEVKKNNFTTLSKAEIDKIRDQYVRGVDKWRRMYMGLSSSLKKYEDGIVYIEIENTEKVASSDFKTAEAIVQSWVGFSKELRQARGWVVYFHKTNVPTGFTISFNDPNNKDILENFVNQMNVKKELQLVNIFSGIFN